MENRFKMVMLPMSDANRSALIENVSLTEQETASFIPHYLYIVDTNATIQVEDWYIDLVEKKLIKSKFGKHQTQYFGYDCKIIASTNPSLDLPTIASYDIQRYVNNPTLKILNVSITPDKKCVIEWEDDKQYKWVDSMAACYRGTLNECDEWANECVSKGW